MHKRIFTGRAAVTVEFFDYSLHLSTDTFLAVGRERGGASSSATAHPDEPLVHP